MKDSKYLFSKKQTYSLRKLSFGLGAVVVGYHVIFGAGLVQADEQAQPDLSGIGIAAEQVGEPVVLEVPAVNENQLVNQAIPTQASLEERVNEVGAPLVDEAQPQEVSQVTITSRAVETSQSSEGTFQENLVATYQDIELSQMENQSYDISSELPKLKELDNATIFIEFKTPENMPNFFNVFSVSSDHLLNDYFTLSVKDGVVLVEGRYGNGTQFYDSYVNAPLKVGAGEWNSLAFTVEKASANNPARVRLYVNGVLSKTSRKSAKFIKDLTDPTRVQFGKTTRAGRELWGSDLEIGHANIYNRALSVKEVAELSASYEDKRQNQALEVEIAKDYLAEEFAASEIVRYENLSITAENDYRYDASSALSSLKTLDNATVYMEFKTPEVLPQFFNLFSVSSASLANEYFTLAVYNGRVLVEGRRGQAGIQFYDSFHQAPLLVKAGEWNSVAFTVEEATATTPARVRLYVNGVLSMTSLKSANFIKDLPTVSRVQFGKTLRANNGVWGGEFEIRHASVHNRAFSQEEVAYRSQLFQRADKSIKAEGLSDGQLVFAAANTLENPDGQTYSYRIPAMLVTDKGTILAGGDYHSIHNRDWGDISTQVKRSVDQGESWSDAVTLLNLRNNPEVRGTEYNSPFSIDMALVQDPESKRIFALYDVFPEGGGALKVADEKPYSQISGKSYLNLYKDNDTSAAYTIRENGLVYTPEGSLTDYRVVMASNKSQEGYSDLGDIYQGSQLLGNIYFTTNKTSPFRVANTSYLWMSHSDDDGQTWSTPTDITSQVKLDWMQFYGTGPGSGIVLHSGSNKGRLIFPVYSTNSNGFQVSQSSRVIYSDDHGLTWQSGAAVNDGREFKGQILDSQALNNKEAQNTEASLVQISNGDLKIFMRNYTGKVLMSTSKDGGETWGSVEEVTDVSDQKVQLSATRLVRDGKEYILLANAGGSGRRNGQIHVAQVNRDGSLTWITHKDIQEGSYAYNVIQVLDDDTVGVLYEHGRTEVSAYSLYFKKANMDFLFGDSPSQQYQVTSIASMTQTSATRVEIGFDNPVITINTPNLKLTTGREARFLGQKNATTLVYELDDKDFGAGILGLTGGQIIDVNQDVLVSGQLPFGLA